MARNGELKPRQRRAIQALLLERDVKAAARACRVGYRTLRGWLREPAFQQALQAAEAEALQALQRRLTALGTDAADVLAYAMRPGEDVRYRLRAADVVLGRLLQVRELVALTERIEALEERLLEVRRDER